MKATVILALTTACLAACSSESRVGKPPAAIPDSGGRMTAAAPAHARADPTDSAAQDTLARVIAQMQLTTLRRECYAFEPADGRRHRYTVREVHGGSCGGDPNTGPRLFDLQFDPATGAVLSDNGPMIRGEDGMDTVRRARTEGRLARAGFDTTRRNQ